MQFRLSPPAATRTTIDYMYIILDNIFVDRDMNLSSAHFTKSVLTCCNKPEWLPHSHFTRFYKLQFFKARDK